MSSNALLALIFSIILALAACMKIGFGKKDAAKVILGVGALFLAAISYLLGNATVPAWILVLSGVFLLGEMWASRKKR